MTFKKSKENPRNTKHQAAIKVDPLPIENSREKMATILKFKMKQCLVGGWTNPFEKYARQIGSFPQGSGWKQKMFETTR